MDKYPLAITAASLSLLYLVSCLHKAWVDRRVLNKIPTVGPQGLFSSYIGAYRSIFHTQDMIQEGYRKYRGSAFKIPELSQWLVVVSGQEMVDDIRKASDDQISFRDAVGETLQTVYTLGPDIRYNPPYHVGVVKTPLTRSLVDRFPDVQDEIKSAFEDYIPIADNWSPIQALPTIMKIVSRSSNRLFVGLPLCRDPDYRDLNIQLTVEVAKAARNINLFPDFLKPLAGRYFSNIEPLVERAMGHLGPLIQDRLDKEAEYGKEWPGKPNDALSWLLDHATGNERTIRALSLRVLLINFAAIHTTSNAFTQVLFDLASHPSSVPELRREVEMVASNEGYSKLAFHKMVKLDSFIKESQRLGGIGGVSMRRKVLKDFTFSNGTVVPAGHTIAVASFSIHHDEENYSDSLAFDGFRFSKLRELQDEGFSKHQMVALNSDYIVFGHGKHACPGRFFAVNELKALLAHTLLNYDVSFENDGSRPLNTWFGTSIIADPRAAVMFRKRRA